MITSNELKSKQGRLLWNGLTISHEAIRKPRVNLPALRGYLSEAGLWLRGVRNSTPVQPCEFRDLEERAEFGELAWIYMALKPRWKRQCLRLRPLGRRLSKLTR